MPVPDSVGAASAEIAPESLSTGPDPEAWRSELSARLNHYRSRHKAPPPRYPSLRLPFDLAPPVLTSPAIEDSAFQAFESGAAPAFAHDEIESETSKIQLDKATVKDESATLALAQSGAKIIEFPRFAWAPPAPPPDQLAEPVIDRPRILEVPEFAPLPPALGGITIEPARVAEPEKRRGIDVPWQSAPLGRRLLASLIDGMIVCAASGLFGFVFWKIALVHPPKIQLLTLAAGIPCLFWAAYQFLLIVYAGSTPGLRLARLQLSRFDGSPAKRSVRRWRVLASYLSAASLGMGYAWLFLDEDNLCWHDRITHTFLGPRKPSDDKR
jgi:uncharacterized RDD family membrane protein YckC